MLDTLFKSCVTFGQNLVEYPTRKIWGLHVFSFVAGERKPHVAGPVDERLQGGRQLRRGLPVLLLVLQEPAAL